jgi:O-antigen ligase
MGWSPGRLYELVFVGLAGILTVGRAAVLSLLAGLLIVTVCRPRTPLLTRVACISATAILALALTGVTIQIPSVARDISFVQMAENLGSVVGNSDKGNLDGTKEWRMEWWRSIAHDTFSGPYFWVGRGFGVSLADVYGYQVDEAGSLRSPHNAYFTIIGRMGAPGIILWAGIQIAWIVRMLADFFRSRARGQRRWSGLFMCLIAYWVPFLVNGSFDVFLEGPMGGIWLWCIFGVGLAASHLYRESPELLPDEVCVPPTTTLIPGRPEEPANACPQLELQP